MRKYRNKYLPELDYEGYSIILKRSNIFFIIRTCFQHELNFIIQIYLHLFAFQPFVLFCMNFWRGVLLLFFFPSFFISFLSCWIMTKKTRWHFIWQQKKNELWWKKDEKCWVLFSLVFFFSPLWPPFFTLFSRGDVYASIASRKILRNLYLQMPF